MIHTNVSGFAVYIRASAFPISMQKIFRFCNGITLGMICVIKANSERSQWLEAPTGTMLGNIVLICSDFTGNSLYYRNNDRIQ